MSVLNPDWGGPDGWVFGGWDLPGVADTVKFDHIKRHYYDTHEGLINRRIVPKGFLLNFDTDPVGDSQLTANTIAH